MMWTASLAKSGELATESLQKTDSLSSHVQSLQWRRRSLCYREIVDEGHEVYFVDVVLPQIGTIRTHERQRHRESTADIYPWNDDWFLPLSV